MDASGDAGAGVVNAAGVAALEVRDLRLAFRGLTVLDGLSFSVAQGSVCAVIGPNGAGKTSLFNCVSRVYQPSAGTITVHGTDMLAVRPHRAAHHGVARTFQNVGLFPALSVLDNVLTGAHARTRAGLPSALLRFPKGRREEIATRAEARDVLDRAGLAAHADDQVSHLPFGTQKRVELARALMARPHLLLLDEPANGLDHGEVAELARFIRDLARDNDLTVLLVEHHIGMVTDVSDHVMVMDLGRRIAEGTAAEVVRDPVVVRAYLGQAA